jgi:PAS domain S-box-containing protein
MSPTLEADLVRRLGDLLSNATTGLALKHPSGPYVWSNDAYRAMHALGPADVAGRADDELLPPALAERRCEREGRVWLTGGGETFEDPLDGGAVHGELLRLDEEGEPLLLGIVCRAGSMAATQERFSSLRRQFSHPGYDAPVGTFDLDLRTGLSEWSPETRAIYGHPRHGTQITADMVMAQQRPDSEVVRAQMADYLATGKPFSFTHRITRLDGAVRVLHCRGTTERDENGEPVRIYGTEQDITDQLSDENELRRMFRHHQLILDSVGDPVFVLDPEGCITFANRAATALLGLEEDQLVGSRLTQLLQPRSACEAVDRTLKDGALRRGAHASLRVGDATEVAVELTASGLGRGDGDATGAPTTNGAAASPNGSKDSRLEGAVVTLRDVSERRRYENRLRASLSALAAANAQRGALLSAAVEAQENERRAIAAEIHDDTVQVMSAVGLRMERVAATLTDPAEVAAVDELRATVREATARLRHLLFTLTPPELAVGTASAIGAFITPLAQREGFAYEVRDQLEEEPPMDARLLVYRIAQEALINVAKHARARYVSVTLERQGGGIRLTVSDDGVGAAKEAVERSRPGHLGVSAMRHRAQLAGGALTISSTPGQGTLVDAWLPAANWETLA